VCRPIPDGLNEADVHGDENDEWSDVQTDEVESAAINVVVMRMVEHGTVDHHRLHRRKSDLNEAGVHHVHHTAVEEPTTTTGMINITRRT